MRYSTVRHFLALLLLAAIVPSLASGQARIATVQSEEKPVLAPKPISRFDGQSGVFVPQWTTDIFVSDPTDILKHIKSPWFKEASLDKQIANLPYYDFLVPVGKEEILSATEVQAENVEEIYAETFRIAAQAAKLPSNTEWYPSSHVMTGQVITIKGEDFQHVMVYPILVNASGNSYKKSDVINYSISRKRDPARRQPIYNGRQGYVAESVLKTGTWYKFAVTSEGMYSLDQSFFSGLGVDPNAIDPSTVRVFGNGGAALPQRAGLYPHDDLVENATAVQGGGDGRFDQGDYVAFYSPGVGRWENNSVVGRYIYFPNFYTDTTYYFVTWGGSSGRHVGSVGSASNPNYTPGYTVKYGRHEVDKDNTIISGRLWMGERFDLTTTQNFDFSLPNAMPGSNVRTTVRVGAKSVGIQSNFIIKEGGTAFAQLTVNATSSQYASEDYYCTNQTFNIPASQVSDGTLNLELVYNKPTTSSVGYLDYIEYEYQQALNLSGLNYFYFTATDSVGLGKVFNYQLSGANGGHQIWDVTDPLNVFAINASLNGNTLSFSAPADSNKRYVAFTSLGFKHPSGGKSVSNQNLHGLPQAEFLIITHPDYLSDANRLADFHRSHYGQSVNVVLIQDVYNEFSSGGADPTAIRDFAKMFYNRGNLGGTPLKYLLLYGDGSYDYKAIKTAAGTNFIPTYQSRRSQLPTGSYTSDDYYGFLDDGEGFWGEQAANKDSEVIPLFLAEGDLAETDHGLDIAVGRFPVANAEESAAVIDKILRYHTDVSAYGPWRNRALLVADHKDDDGNTHAVQANGYSPKIEANSPCTNIDKIFMDNYVMENQASGDRFPDGKAALLKALDEGSLLVNYTGHGGEVGWSNAQILDISDINKIANDIRLPAYITATCEFGRWDDPNRKAGAEILLVRAGGGSIAMFTTVRVVFSGPNQVINDNYYDEVFKFDTLNNRMPTMGEIFMRTKNASWAGGTNNRNFSLLGDPAMQLAYPFNKAVVTKINGHSVQSTVTDTLSALNLITIEGEARDPQDNLMPNYNGQLSVTVFDKPSKFTTRRRPFAFTWQKNKVFKGSATVQNGLFSFQFVVPIDISYEDLLTNLNGKVSLYFHNENSDGGGCDSKVFIGGSGSASITDNRPPEMDLFMNDIKFADGGMVGPDPLLLADIFDENGINTVGTGIGHELTAVLDHDESKVYLLNDYYEAKSNSYQAGTIKYPFKDLSVGEHNLKVKVWDVANNSREGEINFLVADDANMALGHVVNYPNPFTTSTKFFIEHNRNGNALMVQVKVFTVGGTLVKTLQDNFFAEGNLYCDMEWDGRDDYGDLIGRGVYVYQVVVKDEATGEHVTKFEKLVLLR